MSADNETKSGEITLQSTRFGEFCVAADSVIHFPAGLIGFSRQQGFVMLDYKEPFSWLHSIDDASLAFVVIDGSQFAAAYDLKPPYGDKDIDLKEDDEYAVLIVVTVRSDPRLTTANLKAPLFVNVRNRKGVQVIFDNPNLSTRFHLYQGDEGQKPEEPEKK